MTADRDFEEMLDLLGDVTVQFWVCPITGHSGQFADLRQTVEWRGDVAYCLEPGCARSSAADEDG